MKLAYPAILTPFEEGEGNGYNVEFPDLPGCTTCGFDLAEALFMAEDAASGWILTSLEDGEDIPKASDVKDIEVSDDGFVNIIALDMDAYSAKWGKKAVKKNCTIPSWLNELALNANINFSQVLQDALESRLNLG